MRIAVYTITKNEAAHIARWAESAQDADVLVVVDTGSTDDTVEVARAAGCVVHEVSIDPWRFDTARNAALDLVPDEIDMCIALDADEVLLPGWREHLEGISSDTTRPRYRYVWSWQPDGSPGLVYHGDKIHRRRGYQWKHPVHEVLDGPNEVQEFCGLEINHHPDPGKARSYLPLLELAVYEDPEDDRNAHYLAREYVNIGDLARAAAEFKRHLSLPRATWAPERAKSMRLLALCEPHEAESWLLHAIAEDINRRESWVELARLYHDRADWPSCLSAAKRALSITERDMDYLNEAWAWGAAPHDLAALSYWFMGYPEKAAAHGRLACELEPLDMRLANNLAYYEGVVH